MNPSELFKDARRLKDLMKSLDKADGKKDDIVHRDVALRYIEAMKKKQVKQSEFLNAAEAFIQQGPEVQRRLSDSEIDALADIVKNRHISSADAR